MKIRPLQDRLIVKRVAEENKTKGGIIIPDSAKEKPLEGKVIAVGMPGEEKVDWAPIWQRELTVMGAYAYGSEPSRQGRRTFDLALEAAPELKLEKLTGPLFGLGEYRDAIAYAMSAGRLGAVKVAFDLRGLR